MKVSMMAAAGILIATCAAAGAQNTGAGQAADRPSQGASTSMGNKSSTPDFVKKAATAGAAEVEMGKLGSQKATDSQVKAYAQKMVADHTKANTELATLAKSKGLEVPTSPDLLHKGMMEKFERQSADKDFNHDFMQQMVRDHKAVVELYEKNSNDPTVDADVRALAKKTLPTLQEHLKSAQALESKLGK
jgi:putative membrane protein